MRRNYPIVHRGVQRPKRAQWSLAWILFVTTACAIGFAGFSRQGIEGAIGTLFLSSSAIFGCWMVFHSRERLWRFGIGPAILGYSLFGLLATGMTDGTWAKDVERSMRFLSSYSTWLQIGVAIILVIAFLRAAGPRWTVRVEMHSRNIRKMEGVPESKIGAARDFLQKDLKGAPRRLRHFDLRNSKLGWPLAYASGWRRLARSSPANSQLPQYDPLTWRL